MNLTALFFHNAVSERDRVEYGGPWADDEIATVEAALDVLIDDPDHTWRHGQPRAPRKVDGGFNHFQIIRHESGGYSFKQFTWDRFVYLNTIDQVVAYIDYIYRPLSQQRDTWEGRR